MALSSPIQSVSAGPQNEMRFLFLILLNIPILQMRKRGPEELIVPSNAWLLRILTDESRLAMESPNVVLILTYCPPLCQKRGSLKLHLTQPFALQYQSRLKLLALVCFSVSQAIWSMETKRPQNMMPRMQSAITCPYALALGRLPEQRLRSMT